MRDGRRAGSERQRAPDDVVARVLDVVRQLARETGGARAERAVTASASLEREIGLGSLERVELVARLERAFGRALDDASLARRHSGRPRPRDPRFGAERAAAAARARAARPRRGARDRRRRRDTRRVAVAARGARARARARLAARRSGRRSEQAISYGRLRDEAAAVAAGLRERGVGRGDTVALMLPTGLDFLRSFFAIQLVRAVPVPIYPAAASRPARGVRRAPVGDPRRRGRPAAGDDRARAAGRGPAEARGADAAGRRDRRRAGAAGRAAVPAPEGEAADRRLHPVHVGQHRAAEGRAAHPRQPDRQHPRDRERNRAPADGRRRQLAAALPRHGLDRLRGSCACTTACRSRCCRRRRSSHGRSVGCGRSTSGAPRSRPHRTSRTSSARAASPDEALEGLDLSSWRVALNGAEPVSPGTLERFAARFGRCGFAPRRDDAGLRPRGVLGGARVSADRPRTARRPRRAVRRSRARAAPSPRRRATRARSSSCRRAAPCRSTRIRIVDDDGQDVADRVVGRLVFQGPSMTSGYYRHPEATAADHAARRLARTAATSPTARTARSTSAAGART